MILSKLPSQRIVLAAAAGLCALAVASSSSAAEKTTGATGDAALVMTANTGESRVMFIDPATSTKVLEFRGDDFFPGHCKERNGDTSCYTIGINHTVIDDHDYVEMATGNYLGNIGMLTRVPLGEPSRPVWKLTRLDFSDTVHDGSCNRGCGAPGGPGVRCGLQMVHEFAIVDENPQQRWVDVILAEMLNYRISYVHLDYRRGNTCGKVVWTLDSSHPDWPEGYPQPNNVQVVNGPDGKRYMVVSLLTEDNSVQPGASRVFFFDISGSEPVLVWKYPEEGTAELPNINASHSAVIQQHPLTGETYLLYGHSLGNAKLWNVGIGGLFGIAKFENGLTNPPTYLGEWDLPESYDKLFFTRTHTMLGDGSFMGLDAGCYFGTPGVACPGQLYFYTPQQLPTATGLPGAFSANHQYQNIVRLQESEVTKEVKCGLKLVFEADPLSEAQLGQELRAARLAGGTPCPNE